MRMTDLSTVSALFVVGVLAGNLHLADGKNWRYWSNIGCYEFSFERTVFFELTDAATPLSCDGCEGSQLSAIVNTSLIPSPTTPDQIQHFIAGSIRDSNTNTPEECITSCNSTGYEYAAMQDGKTCICTNEQPSAKTSADNCNTACLGNSSFSCGGSWVMDVHQNPAYHSSGLTYIGCYKNTFNDLDRMLFEGTYNNFQNNTPEWCVTYCEGEGYDYAGLQYSSQCICSNSGPQGNSEESQCTYGCAGDSSINMCGGLGYINIFHTDAHKSTIDDYGCGSSAQDTYYQRWFDDMGHCNITPGGSRGSGSGGNGAGPAAAPTPKNHIMLVGGASVVGGEFQFLSLSPNDNPLPACLSTTKKPINIGRAGRTYPALFPSKDGKPLLVGGWNSDVDRSCIRYDGASDSWTLNSTTHFGGMYQNWAYHPDVGLIVAGAHSPKSKEVELSTDYGQTKTSLGVIPYASAYGVLKGACVVIVNKTTVFLAGGRADGEKESTDTYYLNIDTKQWTQGPDMTVKRCWFSCSLITKPFPQIVIVGGYVNAAQRAVDILNLETNELTSGQDLPVGIFGHSQVVHEDKAVILGGSGNLDIYEYDAQKAGSGEEWKKLEVQLQKQHYMGSSVFVDDMDICT